MRRRLSYGKDTKYPGTGIRNPERSGGNHVVAPFVDGSESTAERMVFVREQTSDKSRTVWHSFYRGDGIGCRVFIPIFGGM